MHRPSTASIRQLIARIPPDAFAVGALFLLVVAFFWRMTFTNLILPRGDVFTYFYPYWEYRNAILRTGHIPLWNPYLFMGVPFLANSQAGVLYPPNWLLIPFLIGRRRSASVGGPALASAAARR